MSKNIQIRDDLYDILLYLKGGKEGEKSFSDALDIVFDMAKSSGALEKKIEELTIEDKKEKSKSIFNLWGKK